VALALFCTCVLAYGYFVYRGPHHNPDSRLALTYGLVDQRTLAIDAYGGSTQDRAYAGGRYYSDKAPGVSVWLAPLYAALSRLPGAAFAAPLDPAPAGPPQGDGFLTRYLLTFLGIGLPAAAFAAALFGWLRRVCPPMWPRLAVCVGYALGSPAYPFAVSAFGHVPASMCLFSAFRLCWPGASVGARPRPALRVAVAGVLLGGAVAFEYPAAVAAGVIALYTLWRAPRRPAAAAWLVLGAAPPLALLAGYHWLAFGAPWLPGYARLTPGSAFAAGQAAGFFGVGWPGLGVAVELLVGLKRGLLTHAPWLALSLAGALLLPRWGRWFPEALCAIAVCLGLLAVNSGYAFWDGGASWGPRHLVPALPFLALLALPAARRWPVLSWSLVAVSVLLTVAGVATRMLPDPVHRFPLHDVLAPAILGGSITNNWGQLLGLAAWRGLVPLVLAAVVLAAWVAGFRRSLGWLILAAWALAAAAVLDRRYLEYSEGYYLYLGSRLAAGARLYLDTASTQPPGLPLMIGLLWRIAPDVYLPRLAAIALYVAAALLAGRVAHTLMPKTQAPAVATALAAILPLGAGAPHMLDANAVLAPLAPAVALLWARGTRPTVGPTAPEPGRGGKSGAPAKSPVWYALAAGGLAAAGLSVKLTFVLFALAPIAHAVMLLWPAVSRRGRTRCIPIETTSRGRRSPPPCERRGGQGARSDHHGTSARHIRTCLAAYLAGLVVVGGLHGGAWLLVSGAAAMDGLIGELESPIVPFGAVLAVAQLIQLEGLALALAVAGWFLIAWRDRTSPWLWFGAAAAALPLYGTHQGTFVGVARPAEPFIAAFAATVLVAGAAAVAARAASAGSGRVPLRRGLLAASTILVAVLPFAESARSLFNSAATKPALVAAWIDRHAPIGAQVLVPPYYAALTGRTMLFDYADWTVWGMRAAGGAARERQLAEHAVALIESGALPLALPDFRLTYIPQVEAALRRRYELVATDGDAPARSVSLFRPR
jgi:hypothetical protein